MVDIPHKVMVCPGCAREVPSGAPYCPYCCGEDGRECALRRGGFIGGIFGLMAGGLAASVWFAFIGPEHATWNATLGMVFGGVIAGLVLGLIHQRKR